MNLGTREERLERERKLNEAAAKRPKPKIIIAIEQEQYINTLMWIIGKLPKEPPKDWNNEKAYRKAQRRAKKIIERLFRHV